MVKNIGQNKVNGGWLTPPVPSLCLILDPRWYVRPDKFFHGRMFQRWATAKNFVCQKSSSHFREKLEKPVGGGGGGGGGGVWQPPPLAIGALLLPLSLLLQIIISILFSLVPFICRRCTLFIFNCRSETFLLLVGRFRNLVPVF